MTAPDRCEGCEHNKIYPNEDVTHTCTPPDTEDWEKEAEALGVLQKESVKEEGWEKEFDEIIKNKTTFGHIEDEDFEPAMMFKGAWDVDNFVERVKDFIDKTLNARDTYWKERVRKERVKTRQDIEDAMLSGEMKLTPAGLMLAPINEDNLN